MTWHKVRTQSSVNRALISSFCYILKISFFFSFFFTLKTEVETFKIGVFVILLWNYPHVLCPLLLLCPVASVKRYGQSLFISWISLNTILPKYLFSLLMKLNLLANTSFMPPIPTHFFFKTLQTRKPLKWHHQCCFGQQVKPLNPTNILSVTRTHKWHLTKKKKIYCIVPWDDNAFTWRVFYRHRAEGFFCGITSIGLNEH